MNYRFNGITPESGSVVRVEMLITKNRTKYTALLMLVFNGTEWVQGDASVYPATIELGSLDIQYNYSVAVSSLVIKCNDVDSISSILNNSVSILWRDRE